MGKRQEPYEANMEPITISIVEDEPPESRNLRDPTAKRKRQNLIGRLQQLFQDYPPSKSPQKLIFGIVDEISDFCTLLVLFATASFSLPTIVIGAYFYDDSECPVETKLSPLLIAGGSITHVYGVVGLILKYFALVNRKNQEQGGEQRYVRLSSCSGWLFTVLELSIVLWFYITAKKIYAIQSIVSEDKLSESYCHPGFYLYTYCIVMAVYIVILGSLALWAVKGIVMLCVCCGCCFRRVRTY